MEQERLSKTLFYDLEVAPRKSYIYGKSYDPFEVEIIEDGYIISFAYMWEGESTDDIKFVGLNQFKGYSKTRKAALVSELWELFNEAEVIIGHNSDKFDQKVSNTYFIKQGHKPPSPYMEVDTLKLARKILHLPNNKLDTVAKELGLAGKTEHSAKDLCVRADKGEDVWSELEQYNKQDVKVVYDVYHKLQAWNKNLPAHRVFGYTCPRCMSKLQRWGYMNNKPRTAQYQRFKCVNCGYHAQGTKALNKQEYEKPDVK